MATEIGGQQLTVIGSVTPKQAQMIDDFFKSIFGTDASGKVGPVSAPVEIQPGIQEYASPTTGQKISVVDEDYPGSSVKFDNDDANIVIGNGKVGEIITTKVDNKILVVDDGNHVIRSKGGNDNIVITGNGDNVIVAKKGDDTIVIAGGGNNIIKGGKGADNITGGTGNDIIRGGEGNDTIDGGAGDDILRGGSGKDTFVFKNETTGHDTIKGFNKQDVLQIADRNGDGKVVKGGGPDADFSVAHSGKDDTLITFKNGDTILLKHVKPDQLDGNEDGIFHI
jgi:Ca2+-binding RTX toxin-like protein